MKGILIKNGDKTLFDSTKSHLIVPIGKNPPYLGLTSLIAPSLSVGGGGNVDQTVLTIEHGLKYAPFVDTYFYPASAQPTNPDQYFQITDSYYKNFFSYLSLGGTDVDLLKVRVDDVSITVFHHLESLAGFTSAPFPVMMKFTIYANQGYLQP